ncbi:hypothetical protein ACHQM5_010004 [Ranunculus cassubicifolius]
MRNIFSSRSTSPSTSSHPSPLRHHHKHTFSESLIEENMEIAEAIIKKWNPEGSNYNTVSYLFADNPREAKEFLKSVADLQSAMHFFVSQQHISSAKIINAQNLMEIAMKRLEKEFYQILSANRAQLDSESISGGRSSHASENSRMSTSDLEDSEDEVNTPTDSLSELGEASTLVMSDLRSIAECMTAAGYGKECVKIYKIIRKSIVDEGLYHLGIEKLTQAQINKLNWDVLESKIKNWVHAVKVAVKTIFSGERILCDFVFSGNNSIRESCFTEITREGANMLFTFPEFVAKAKKSPERMFRILDLYDSISEHWPDIELIFSFESTTIVRSQAVSSLIKLGDAVRSLLIDFEAAIQKDSSKAAVPGGGIHPLTRYVMNYICFLSDYSGLLNDITADWPLPEKQNLPETYLDSSSDNDSDLTSVISIRFQWLILVLLCKLDGKTELFKDVSLSYLFLANNLNYVVSKIRSSNLKFLLGQEWISRHEDKVMQYASNYKRMGWNKVVSSLPENGTTQPEELEGYFQRFSSAFEMTYKAQSSWVVSDGKLRDEIKTSLSKMIVPAYKAFYDKYQAAARQGRHRESVVRYTPEDLGYYLSDLLCGNGISGSNSSRGSSHSR